MTERKESCEYTLYGDLDGMTNQNLIQLVRAGIPAVSNAAEQMLAKRGVWLYDAAEIDNRLSDSYIKHLELKFA